MKIEMNKLLDERYLIIDTFRNSVPNSQVSLRITHKPTGKTVEGNGNSSATLKRELLEDLARKGIE